MVHNLFQARQKTAFLAGILIIASIFLLLPVMAAPWNSAQVGDSSWGTSFGDLSRSAVKGGTIPACEVRLTWRHALPEKTTQGAQTAITEGIVFIATDEPSLIALNFETGSLIWKTSLEGPLLHGTRDFPARTGLLATGSTVVATGERFVTIFDAFSGEPLGGFKSETGIIELCELSGEYMFLSVAIAPTVPDDFAILAMNLVSSKVFRVLETTRPVFLLPVEKRLLWGNFGGVFVLEEKGASNLSLRRPEGQIAYTGNELYFYAVPPKPAEIESAGQTTELICLDTLRGREKWTCLLFDPPAGPPVVTGSNVLISTFGRRIYSIFRKTGTIQWIRQYPAQERPAPATSGSLAMKADLSRLPLCDGVRVAVKSGQTLLVFSLAKGAAEEPVILPFADGGPAGIEAICPQGKILIPLLIEGRWSLGCFEGIRDR